MQQNFSNKSHLIRLTDVQKKKARRRLIGSIFLLLLALIILLNVTSKITPVEVEHKKLNIEIKNTSSQAISLSANSSSSPVKSATTTNSSVASGTMATITINASAPGAINVATARTSPSTENANGNTESGQTNANSKNTAPTLMFKPRLITDPIKSKLLPEDILEGKDADSVVIGNRYYVQLIASSDKEKLIHFQDILANKGIKTLIQNVDTPNGIVYRLRVGPFNNKNDADSMLNTVTELNGTEPNPNEDTSNNNNNNGNANLDK
ncbi:MAG: DedD protein [Pseudomonadota bacterium]|nr:DedD protein [Pseudomonadota bacterium]